MSEYEAPLWDMRFVLEHVADLPALAALPGCDHAQPAVVEELLEHAARFMREVVSPLNAPGDQQGSHLENGEVRTPPGFREAYQAFIDAGWGAVALAADHGGAGLPYTIGEIGRASCRERV